MTTVPARPAIPAQPAIYIWDYDVHTDGRHSYLIDEVQDELAWPEPAVYAEAGPADQRPSETCRELFA